MHEMIGENYPEKELLKNDPELMLRGCNAVAFVPFLIACLPQRGYDGLGEREVVRSKAEGGPLIFLLFRMAGILWEGRDKRINLFILVCPDYLLSLPSISLPLKT